MNKKNVKSLNSYLADVGAIAYGCMGLGGGWDQNPISTENIKQAHQVIDSALSAGINLFDHADIYTLGKAEKAFGQVLAERPELRESIYLQSKCAIRFADSQGPKRYDFSKEWINLSVDNILSRLNTDYLDVLMLHRPDPLMELDEVADTLLALKRSGKVRHFGVSNMQYQQIAYLQSALDAPLVANQIEISLAKLDWIESGIMAGNPDGRDINFTAGTLEYCQANNVQIQAWGSLAQGLFSGRNTQDQPDSVKATAALVSQLAHNYQVAPEAIVLAWLMRHPMGVQPVIGTTNLDRISACGQAVNINLSRNEWYSLYETSRGQELP
ncbi:aldo/keto reductase [Psychromonas antarctica]|uniref:aldo/keto reductase n=1 Tax=Psychromonas antarctica TaxID=67573 RepID=UPI001EE8CCFA|nr:aldo/keto reductase [Psychromonas antarctica]MCG6201467.1 aldo/keto reductase [Psychromonas antarctica]